MSVELTRSIDRICVILSVEFGFIKDDLSSEEREGVLAGGKSVLGGWDATSVVKLVLADGNGAFVMLAGGRVAFDARKLALKFEETLVFMGTLEFSKVKLGSIVVPPS